MKEDAERLLMMFIRDSYANRSGKPGKKTAIELMKYVASEPELSRVINDSDHKAVLAYRSS